MKFSNSFITVFLLAFISFTIHAQEGAVGIGITTPDESSILHIDSAEKGVIFPINDKESISNPALGLMVYDWDDMGYYFYDGNQWRAFSTAADSLWNINEENIYSIPNKSVSIGQNFSSNTSKLTVRPDSSNVSAIYIDNPVNGSFSGLRVTQRKKDGLGLWIGSIAEEGTGTGGFMYSHGEQGIGVHGYATNKETTLKNKGGLFESEGDKGIGVHGHAINTDGTDSYGGLFQSEGISGVGVYGEASNFFGDANFGGVFVSNGTNGYGARVVSHGIDGIGLHVVADNPASTNQIGALIEAIDDNALGIKVATAGVNATSILAESTGEEGIGISASSTGADGVSVRSISYGETGIAGYFQSLGSSGSAILATSTGDEVNTLHSVSSGELGKGVSSIAYGLNGVGIFGSALHDDGGTGGWFKSKKGTAIKGESTFSGSGVHYGGSFSAKSVNGYGVYSISSGHSSTAVYGNANSEIGSNRGGSFFAAGGSGIGVFGSATKTGAVHNYGGRFEASGDYAHGVYALVTGTEARALSGIANGDEGIGAEAEANGDNAVGMYSVANGENGRGLVIYANGADGKGIDIIADGLSGTAIKTTSEGALAKGIEVEMTNTGTNNVTYGGHFLNKGLVGRAVYGLADNSSGTVNYGGFFESQGQAGRAVYGYANHASGSNYAGYFRSNSPAGTGVYAEGDKYAGLFEGNIEMHTNDGSEIKMSLFEGAGFGFEFLYDGSEDDLNLWSKKFSGNEAVRMTWKKNGSVGIGTEDPSEKLEVDGNIKVSGSVFASCGTLSCSDQRFKSNIRTIQNSIDLLSKVDGVYYDWKTEEYPKRNFSNQEQIGVIAQQLEKQFPQVVHIDDKGYRSVAYDKLVPVLIEAIKELNRELENSVSKINSLESSINNQEHRLVELEKILISKIE